MWKVTDRARRQNRLDTGGAGATEGEKLAEADHRVGWPELDRSVKGAARLVEDLVQSLLSDRAVEYDPGPRMTADAVPGQGRQHRRYFKIGEACKIVGVPAWTLRYWERYVFQLRSVRRRNGRRYYSPYQLKVACAVARLITEKGYTLEGACKQLEGELAESHASQALASGKELLESCQQFIAAAERILAISGAEQEAGNGINKDQCTI
jgi:DNA-binding transcriptional MerR regulator